jgi:hypothetical protein
MNLSIIWKKYLKYLLEEDVITSVEKKDITGLPFLYLNVDDAIKLNVEELEQILSKHAMQCMKGKRLNFFLAYVRQEENIYVYRARFLVPQEKMFCCGNLCEDCIRLKGKDEAKD